MDVEEAAGDGKLAGLQVNLPALRHAGEEGCGDLRGVYDLIDVAVSLGLGFLHVAPVFDSLREDPERVLSAGAFDPMFLDTSPSGLEDVKDGMRRLAAPGNGGDTVNYGPVRERKLEALWEGFQQFLALPADSPRRRDWVRFAQEEEGWLEPYARHGLLADLEQGQRDWRLWPAALAVGEAPRRFVEDLKRAQPEAVARQLGFHVYVQWIVSRQWGKLADYASLRGVRLMTDLPAGNGSGTIDSFLGGMVGEAMVSKERARRLRRMFSMVRLRQDAGHLVGEEEALRGFTVFVDALQQANGLFRWNRIEPRGGTEEPTGQVALFGMDSDLSLRERWLENGAFRARFDRREEGSMERYGAGALQELLRSLYFSEAQYVLVGYRDLVGGSALPDIWSRYRVSVEDLLRYPSWERLRRNLRTMAEESGRRVSRRIEMGDTQDEESRV